MEIRLLEDERIHADMHDEANSCFLQFWEKRLKINT